MWRSTYAKQSKSARQQRQAREKAALAARLDALNVDWPKPEFREILREIWLYFERSETRDTWPLFKEVPQDAAVVWWWSYFCEAALAKTGFTENCVVIYS